MEKSFQDQLIQIIEKRISLLKKNKNNNLDDSVSRMAELQKIYMLLHGEITIKEYIGESEKIKEPAIEAIEDNSKPIKVKFVVGVDSDTKKEKLFADNFDRAYLDGLAKDTEQENVIDGVKKAPVVLKESDQAHAGEVIDEDEYFADSLNTIEMGTKVNKIPIVSKEPDQEPAEPKKKKEYYTTLADVMKNCEFIVNTNNDKKWFEEITKIYNKKLGKRRFKIVSIQPDMIISKSKKYYIVESEGIRSLWLRVGNNGNNKKWDLPRRIFMNKEMEEHCELIQRDNDKKELLNEIERVGGRWIDYYQNHAISVRKYKRYYWIYRKSSDATELWKVKK